MPYIITTRPDCGCGWGSLCDNQTGCGASFHEDRSTSHAVATLEEARDAALDIMWPYTYDKHACRFEITAEIGHLPESGGTIGPLPDGTVIEVERVSLATLHARIVNGGTPLSEGLLRAPERLTIAAYNAR